MAKKQMKKAAASRLYEPDVNQNILNKDYLTNFIVKKQELRD